MQAVLVDETNTQTESHPKRLVLEIQCTVAALANIETRFALDRESLLDWAGPEAIKKRLLRQLETRYSQQRDTLVRRLEELHRRTTMPLMFG